MAINGRKIIQTVNLACNLETKNGAQLMLTTNIEIEDKLVNWLVPRAIEFKSTANTISNIHVKCDDERAGKM